MFSADNYNNMFIFVKTVNKIQDYCYKSTI